MIYKLHAIMEAVCVLPEGVILFRELANGNTKVVVDLKNLAPGKHGFHIHEYGDMREGCSSCCSHFNPYGQQHGGRDSKKRHVGDLGNIVVNDRGVCKCSFVDSRIKLKGRCNIIGRSVMIHADEDDLGLGGDDESLRTGNAGARISCGVIGISRGCRTRQKSRRK